MSSQLAHVFISTYLRVSYSTLKGIVLSNPMSVSLSAPLIIIIIWKKQKYKTMASHCPSGLVWLGKSRINVQVEALQKDSANRKSVLAMMK